MCTGSNGIHAHVAEHTECAGASQPAPEVEWLHDDGVHQRLGERASETKINKINKLEECMTDVDSSHHIDCTMAPGHGTRRWCSVATKIRSRRTRA